MRDVKIGAILILSDIGDFVGVTLQGIDGETEELLRGLAEEQLSMGTKHLLRLTGFGEGGDGFWQITLTKSDS